MPTARKWSELDANDAFVRALDEADKRAQIPRKDALMAGRPQKHAWSNAFADCCAHMIAGALREDGRMASYRVLPDEGESAERTAFAVGDKKKRIDVAALETLFGLRLGVSLKGFNFRDASGSNFDKNLTGRTYELRDEVLLVHRHLPMSFLVGLYFLPVGAATDKKTQISDSSFARTVALLRSFCTRMEPLMASQMDRVDMAAVALYVPGDVEVTNTGDVIHSDTLTKGVIRFFDVEMAPPRRGLPKVESTLSLADFVRLVVDRFETFTTGGPINFAEPEE